jgi:UDP-2,4-diacetamido-2,4,6-trideoxy-beta-L-altropyranose hydrolase
MHPTALAIFRTDASVNIGAGHVMRCMTLAETLREADIEAEFICRAYSGNLNDILLSKGFKVRELPDLEEQESIQLSNTDQPTRYREPPGVPQEQDAAETIRALGGRHADCLIVDHYQLDEVWESCLQRHTHKMMVITDLIDHRHECDILLNQNYFLDNGACFSGLVPPGSTQLVGPKYALLRREFSEARNEIKPQTGRVRRVFVSFGGADVNNLTERALDALSSPELEHLEVDIVIGAQNPHHHQIKRRTRSRKHTSLYVQPENIAQIMARADLGLGAGGTTTWERLSLGLPSLVVTTAENQRSFTEDLDQSGFLTWLGDSSNVGIKELKNALVKVLKNTSANRLQSERCAKLVDGRGSSRVRDVLLEGMLTNSPPSMHNAR